MKKYLLAFLLLPAICFAQVKTEVNLGLDPVTGESGYQNKDTFRTVYFQTPGFTVIGDTVYNSNSGVWSLNGTKAYYLGYAGLGTTNPVSRFEVKTSYNTVTENDTLGAMLTQGNPATNSVFPTSPPLSFKVPAWNTSTSSSQYSIAGIYAQGTSGPGNAYPAMIFTSAKDTTAASKYTWMSYGVGGDYISANSTITAAKSIFVQGNLLLLGVGGSISQTGASGQNMFNNPASGYAGQTVFGKNGYTYPIEPSAIAAFYSMPSGSQQGMLIPTLPQSSIDSMGFTVGSITVTGGSGYTTAPTIGKSGGGNPNGVQSWGGNYLVLGTATISGGSLTGVPITHGGYYNGAVTLTVSGGGGTGATATAVMTRLLPEGLIVYNTTIHAFQTWTGSRWSTGSYVSKTSTLASGTVTVSEPSVLSTSRIIVSCNTPSGTQGFLSVPQSSVSAGSFVINSSSGSDNSTVNWIVTN